MKRKGFFFFFRFLLLTGSLKYDLGRTRRLQVMSDGERVRKRTSFIREKKK